MVLRLFFGWVLLAVCVAIHAGGLSAALRWIPRDLDRYARFWNRTRLFVVVAAWIIVLHLLEITAWAVFFVWQGAMPDLPSSLYFSAVTYTTTGYGDVVLPQDWRLLGGVEALTGILMCGWSTAFFFAVIERLLDLRANIERWRGA
jgi:voltage-gated potassium channel Kch